MIRIAFLALDASLYFFSFIFFTCLELSITALVKKRRKIAMIYMYSGFKI